MSKIELLAPAGNYNSFIAAINAGADAIYLGGKNFSARAYSSNFTNEEIAKLIKYAHIRDVKVYVTVNTLIFEDEFFEAVEFVKFLYLNDVDGILLQDLGLAHYLHQIMPDLVLHASTQLNCHNLIMAKSLINLGFKRIVLAREVSLEEAKRIKELGVEVEVFVQGALCVSYSGSCLMSSFIGGRSGNRGKCAQPCRNHVTVGYSNNEKKDYAISTKDLMTLDLIDQYQKIGIDSLKIEGRMKKEEYIFQVVSSYRQAIDHNLDYQKEKNKIMSLFNRKFTHGYIFNESRTKVLNQDTPSNLGTPLGTIINVQGNIIQVRLEDDVHIKDGIKFINKDLDGMLLTYFEVNRVSKEKAKKGEVISFKVGSFKLKVGTKVNKTTSFVLEQEIDEKIKNQKKLIPLQLTISGNIGEFLKVKIIDNRGQEINYQSSLKLEKAINNGTSKERIISQMSKFDDAPYYYSHIDYLIEDLVFVPISSLNEVRKEVLDLVNKQRENLNHYSNRIESYKCDLSLKNQEMTILKVENKDQFEALKDLPYKLSYSDSSLNSSFTFLKRIDHNDDSYLRGNQITSYYKETEGKGIYSYYGNVTNSYTLDLLFKNYYDIVFASVECSKKQLIMMNEAFKKRHGVYPCLGVLVYGHIDYMIMKSCPIASSNNLEHDHCNLCRQNKYYLKDRMNVKFPIITNQDCISRILSNRPISLTSKIDELRDNHFQIFMLDFTFENPSECLKVIDKFEKKERISEKDFYGHYLNQVD